MAAAERECTGGFMSTSLQKAAVHGQVELVERALECTATNIDAVDSNGETALMIAASNGHNNVLRALCDAGADVTLTNGDGLTAADIASRAGKDACVQLLKREAERRDALEAAIRGIEAQQSGAPLPAAAARPTMPPVEDLMAKMLAEAGVAAGPKESPF